MGDEEQSDKQKYETATINVLITGAIEEEGMLGALPVQGTPTIKQATEVVAVQDVRRDIARICSELSPEAIDPNNEIGVAETRIALVVAGKAGVKLLGEVSGEVKASVEVTLRRSH